MADDQSLTVRAASGQLIGGVVRRVLGEAVRVLQREVMEAEAP